LKEITERRLKDMNREKRNHSAICRLIALPLFLLMVALTAVPSQTIDKNAVLEGVVTNTGNGTFIIKTSHGARQQVVLSDETNILRDDVEFSIANIDRMVLPASSIRVGSRLEVVAQYKDGRCVAHIVTLISSDSRWNQMVARNNQR